MASSPGNPIPRAQLALFLPNTKLIQDFEKQQQYLTDGVPADVALAQATADAAQATANDAESKLTNSQFLTLVATPALAAHRRLAPTADFVLTDNGAGTTAALALNQATQILAADATDSTGVFTSLAGMGAVVPANSTFLIEGELTFQSASAIVGIGVAFTLPAAASICGGYRHNVTATTEQAAYNNLAGTVSGNTTAVPVVSDNVPLIGRWIVKTAASAGTIQMQFRSGSGGTAVTVKGGLSAISIRKIA